jgi:hypothetical protein
MQIRTSAVKPSNHKEGSRRARRSTIDSDVGHSAIQSALLRLYVEGRDVVELAVDPKSPAAGASLVGQQIHLSRFFGELF